MTEVGSPKILWEQCGLQRMKHDETILKVDALVFCCHDFWGRNSSKFWFAQFDVCQGLPIFTAWTEKVSDAPGHTLGGPKTFGPCCVVPYCITLGFLCSRRFSGILTHSVLAAGKLRPLKHILFNREQILKIRRPELNCKVWTSARWTRVSEKERWSICSLALADQGNKRSKVGKPKKK